MISRRIRYLAMLLLLVAIGAPATSKEALPDGEIQPCHYYCLKPWAVFDRWDDANSNGVYDAEEFYDPIRTGYVPPDDVGAPIVLKQGAPVRASTSGFVIDFPPLGRPDRPHVGAAWYKEWITGCAAFLVAPRDRLQLEPGNMAGSTISAVHTLLARDPDATWDPVTKSIRNSQYSISPRLVAIPFLDPRLFPASGRNHVRVSKLAVVFVESTGPGNQVNGRFIKVTGQAMPCTAQGVEGSLTLDVSAAPEEPGRIEPIQQHTLYPASPNPFRNVTSIRYTLGAPTPVRIQVFDANGRLVRALLDLPEQPMGDHWITWDGFGQNGLPIARGVYLYRLRAGSFTATRRLILLR